MTSTYRKRYWVGWAIAGAMGWAATSLANEAPAPPELAVPELFVAEAAVMCVDCDAPFDTSTHKLLLQDLAANPFIAELRRALYVQDIARQFQSRAHFDNCDFTSSMDYIGELLEETDQHVATALAAREKGNETAVQRSVRGAFYTLGQAMHGVQDFYAHSNYVELQAPRVKKVTDIDVVAPWRPAGRTRIAAMQSEGLVSGYVFWGFPQKCPDGTASHSELAKDSADTDSGKVRIPHLRNITQYSAAAFLAREASLALMRDAFLRWPLLKEINGQYIAFETFVDRRTFKR